MAEGRHQGGQSWRQLHRHLQRRYNAWSGMNFQAASTARRFGDLCNAVSRFGREQLLFGNVQPSGQFGKVKTGGVATLRKGSTVTPKRMTAGAKSFC